MNYISRLIESKPEYCSKCRGKVYFVGNGVYHCRSCGTECMDDYGKIKEFLKENEGASAIFVSQAIGVDYEVVEHFLATGGEEIPRESRYYLKCEKCGASMHQGRYCSFCISEITGGIKTLLNDDIRRIGYLDPNMAGKMHMNNRRK
ncbi:MAG: hypothetical protein IJX63_07000 [Lachnospiraceae bacterium]|nr:hypothetical protein [Lachnospiraceae bacterium]